MTESNVQNGFIGNLITGKVQTGTANKIYVTLTSGMVVEVINLRVPNTFRTCVKIGYDSNFLSGILQVLGYWYNSETKTIDAHHTQHEWPSPDTVFVKGEQFYPCLFEPIVGTMQVKIFPGVYKTPMGWKNIKSTTIIDLTSHIPSTSGNARYAIIALDASGSFAVREGVEVSGFANLAESHLPTPTTGDACVCGVMLFQGHTALRKDNNNNDFIDLRFSGASGGATNAPNITVLSVLLNSADAKTTPVDADTLPITDSAASNVLKKVTWLSIKTTLKTYFDTLYATVSHTHSTFAALSHTHSGSDIASGTLDGDRLPGLSATKKGGVPATGTPSGKYLKDDGTWATVSGGSGGGGTYGLNPIDVTSQITGSTNHFTFSPVADSILVMVDGLLQNPSNVTLDTDGLGFTLAFTPTTSDTNSLLALCMTPGSGGGGGSSLPTWITNHPDNPPSSPNSMDDEFEETTLNSKWSQQGGGTYTWNVSGGSVRFQQAAAPSERLKGLEQVISGSAWKFRTRAFLNSGGSNFIGVGLYVRDSVSGKVCWFGMIHHSSHGYFAPLVLMCSDMDTYIAEVNTDVWYMSNRWYMELEYDGTNFIFRHSADGINYFTIYTHPQSAYLATTPNRVGIAVHRWNPLGMDASYDWFRRIS